MSSTAYQTNAKPRGRRGSHGEVSEKPARSRASSSASTKLSRTLSRTLDDVYVSRNSRPTSPAVYYWYRQRPLDSKTSDQAGASSRQPTLSLKSDRSHQPQPVADTSPRPVSPTKDRPHVFQDVHQFEMPEPGRRAISPSKLSKHAAVEPVDTMSEGSAVLSLHPPPSSSGLGRKTQSSRSLASMQPTVAEESEEFTATQIMPLPPKHSMSTPIPATVITPPTRISKSLHEEDVAHSPRTSKSSVNDTVPVPAARTSASSLHEHMLASVPQGSVAPMRHEAVAASP